MISIVPDGGEDKIAFFSSVKEDRWHRGRFEKAYEMWHFDALSDSHTEYLAITFLDNFVFSTSYNRTEKSPSGNFPRIPAVALMYYNADGTFYRATAEYTAGEMKADGATPECRIAGSSFRYASAPYGEGFTLEIDLPLQGEGRIQATLEWLTVEGDLAAGPKTFDEKHHYWNVVAPRSDVAGKIVASVNGSRDIRHFRGTGYHDHKLDKRWFSETVSDWHWGRVHFADSTAVFCRYRETGNREFANRMILIRDEELFNDDAHYEEFSSVRTRFGWRSPSEFSLRTKSGAELSIDSVEIIYSAFYFSRALASFSLALPDGSERRTKGITDLVFPGALRNRWLSWMNDT